MALIAARTPPRPIGSIVFSVNGASDNESARITGLPDGFGDGEFTFQVWFRCDDGQSFADCSVAANQLNSWDNNTPAAYVSAQWWFRGNFLLDGHNNQSSNFFDGTFSIQICNGRVRWTFGDGTAADARVGDIHACQDYSSINVVDGNWHRVTCVREFSGGDSILRLYVDGVEVDNETSTGSQTNMATTYWDSWTGFPAAQQGWYFGAEKQAAIGILDRYESHYGELSEVSFFSSALPASAIANLPVPLLGGENNLVGIYRLDEQTGTTASDDLASGGDISLVDGSASASVTWSSVHP